MPTPADPAPPSVPGPRVGVWQDAHRVWVCRCAPPKPPLHLAPESECYHCGTLRPASDAPTPAGEREGVPQLTDEVLSREWDAARAEAFGTSSFKAWRDCNVYARQDIALFATRIAALRAAPRGEPMAYAFRHDGVDCVLLAQDCEPWHIANGTPLYGPPRSPR